MQFDIQHTISASVLTLRWHGRLRKPFSPLHELAYSQAPLLTICVPKVVGRTSVMRLQSLVTDVDDLAVREGEGVAGLDCDVG